MVQDRPREEAFFVVADAGEGHVIAEATHAVLEWPANRSVEAEGAAAPEVEAQYHWQASSGAAGGHPQFDFVPPVGLTVVELNVTAKNHTASDAVGILSVPDSPVPGGRLYVALVGGLTLGDADTGAPLTGTAASVGGHTGWLYALPLPSLGWLAAYRLLPPSPGEGADASVLIAVKDGVGFATANATGAVAFDGGLEYTLTVDTSFAAAHRVAARAAAGAEVENRTLASFAAAHPGEEEVRVLVPAPAQKLPGFEGAAAAFAVALAAALLAAGRRRRS